MLARGLTSLEVLNFTHARILDLAALNTIVPSGAILSGKAYTWSGRALLLMYEGGGVMMSAAGCCKKWSSEEVDVWMEMSKCSV